jgi:hypothetical protein
MMETQHTNRHKVGPFHVMDCALVALATGRKARQLVEFRNLLAEIPEASVYHHFWGGLLQARFEEREYNNDFAAWVRHGIHDEILAERLAALHPADFPDLQALRLEILELIDSRLDEAEYLSWTRATRQFEFTRSQIVVFNTERRLDTPAALGKTIGELSTSSIFYHFIDARRRTADRRDDFSDWLAACDHGYEELLAELADIDPYFGSLDELRRELLSVVARHGEALQ